MLVMAAMCLPCVLPLWRAGSLGAARMLMGGALFMVAVHAALLLIPGGTGAGHQHGASAVLISAPAASVSAAATAVVAGPAGAGSAGATGSGVTESPFGMLALIAGELAVAMLAATWLRRRALSACAGQSQD